MSSHDDPEARIRDLERSLAASYSESSAPPDEQEQYPPPTAPWPYDAPVPPRSGRGGFVAAISVAVLLVVLGTGVAIYLTTRGDSSPVPGRPSMSGGDFPATSAPSLPPTALSPTAPSPPATAPPPGSTLTVSGIEDDESLHCDNNSVSVSGIDNVITVTGHCLKVEVSGIRNTVNVESADVISASGIENRVTYRFGAPEVTRSGFENVIEQGGG